VEAVSANQKVMKGEITIFGKQALIKKGMPEFIVITES
jgi:hypothetical protein